MHRRRYLGNIQQQHKTCIAKPPQSIRRGRQTLQSSWQKRESKRNLIRFDLTSQLFTVSARSGLLHRKLLNNHAKMLRSN